MVFCLGVLTSCLDLIQELRGMESKIPRDRAQRRVWRGEMKVNAL
jgi:hypothetical protein